ncbi:serine hydrolase domain-containing protein [Paenibacillus xylanexedens]|uniref:serine hydrolase domain-containing protein n=1 Tax=Paenibacillus xylanexedens TaxID=528191 RepID=UPI003D049535
MKRNTFYPPITPEEQGITSAGINDFLAWVEAESIELHGFVLKRHGHLVTEGWWKPYRPEMPHAVYSLTKSFTSMATGFAVQEGLLSVEDPVLNYFPEVKPAQSSIDMGKLRIRHLLTMTTGHDTDTARLGTTGRFMDYRAELRIGDRTDGDKIQAFFDQPLVHEPGTHFLYNTGASYVLGAIVERVAGVCLADYLHPRLFQPLGISKPIWEQTSEGGNIGGWGLSLRTRDVAEFGQFLLNQGQWNGTSLLSPSWIQQATSCQVNSVNVSSSCEEDANIDWQQGYGYQFWQCRHQAYRADGAFGQYCIVLPERNAVIAIQAGLSDMQRVMDAIWTHLLPAMQDAALPPNLSAQQQLSERLTNLEVGLKTSIHESMPVTGTRRYKLEQNKQNLKCIALSLTNQSWYFEWKDDAGTQGLSGRYEWGEARLPSGRLVAVKGSWIHSSTLEICICMPDSPHYDRIRFVFEDQIIHMDYVHLNFECIEERLKGHAT